MIHRIIAFACGDRSKPRHSDHFIQPPEGG
jgi:hypothetical protein